MKSFSCSIRLIITLTVLFMGLQGLVVALFSGEIYREHAIKNHKATITKLINIRTDQLLADLADNSQQLGLSQQQQPEFKLAMNNKDADKLEAILNSHFHRYFVTAGILNLKKLIVYDRDFTFVAETTEGDTTIPKQAHVCKGIFANARNATGPDRLKVKTGVCKDNGKTYHVVITPIGGLLLKGFMAVITNPVTNLIAIEDTLGMPMKFFNDEGELIYKSSRWNLDDFGDDFLITDNRIVSQFGETSLHVVTIENIEPLYSSMPNTRLLVMLSASLVTLIAVIISLIILNRTTLNPLRKMASLLTMVSKEKEKLKDKIEIKGTTEIRQLANSFNQMKSELDELHDKMERMAFTDQLTSLPNRRLFNHKLSDIISRMQHPDDGFALFIMDLNKFKPINDSLGHAIGDKVLQEVGARLSDVLRVDDMLIKLEEENMTEKQKNTIARLGGDEFAAIISDIDTPDKAAIVVRKIIKSMQEPFLIEGHKLELGISIGIALYPTDSVDESELLYIADVAMYYAKNNQSHYAFYKHAM